VTAAGLLQAFERWAEQRQPLVLATVYETEGSTYSKAGAQMLITGDGKFQGMLSGGCLEGDLAERARTVVSTGEPQSVTYDLGQNDEELWGLGVGCDGLMRIFLQPILPAQHYEPFATMARALSGDDEQVAATVITSGTDALTPGATMVTVGGELSYCDIGDALRDELSAQLGASLLEGRSAIRVVYHAGGQATILFAMLTPPPAILVLGAGLDAEPVVRYAAELGWRVTVQDHRPAYIAAGDFSLAEQVHCVPVGELATTVKLERFAAAIVMSHHLVSDRAYLTQLAKTRMRYIGLLGPVDRRRRLLEELGSVGSTLADRVHGPAGLDIGGRGPASIALSIIAEMHQQLMRPADA